MSARAGGDEIVLEKHPESGMFSPLPDDSERDSKPEGEAGRLPDPDRTARLKKPQMTSEEFYAQMERSMAENLIPLSSNGRLILSRMKPKG